MAVMAEIGYPFENCDSDTQTVDATGGTLAVLFTNLAFTKGRGIMLQNRGSVNVLFGKTAATARWRILPGSILTVYPKDLAKVAIKAESDTASVDIFLVV